MPPVLLSSQPTEQPPSGMMEVALMKEKERKNKKSKHITTADRNWIIPRWAWKRSICWCCYSNEKFSGWLKENRGRALTTPLSTLYRVSNWLASLTTGCYIITNVAGLHPPPPYAPRMISKGVGLYINWVRDRHHVHTYERNLVPMCRASICDRDHTGRRPRVVVGRKRGQRSRMACTFDPKSTTDSWDRRWVAIQDGRRIRSG